MQLKSENAIECSGLGRVYYSHRLFGRKSEFTALHDLSIQIVEGRKFAFALLAGVLTFVFRDWIVISAVATGMLLILSGAVIPMDSLPMPFNYFGYVLPLTHGLVAFRDGFQGASLVSVGRNLLWELAVGSSYAISGYFLFSVLEEYAKRTGDYEASDLY